MPLNRTSQIEEEMNRRQNAHEQMPAKWYAERFGVRYGYPYAVAKRLGLELPRPPRRVKREHVMCVRNRKSLTLAIPCTILLAAGMAPEQRVRVCVVGAGRIEIETV